MKSSPINFLFWALVSLVARIDTFSIKPNKPMTSAAVPHQVVGTCPPRDSNETIFLKDESDCRIYYVCSNGEAIANVCPPGQAWNSNINTCDWELNVECNKRSLGLKKAPKTAVGKCPSQDAASPTYLADSENCHQFYECSNGYAYPVSCPGSLVWSPESNTCVWSNNNSCSASES